ncbi:MAG: transposase family protein [Cyanobacteria bacterium P01_D01_bin.56]
MQILVVADTKTSHERTRLLLAEALNSPVASCLAQVGINKISHLRPDIVFLVFAEELSLLKFIALLQKQSIELDQEGYYPILVGFLPHGRMERQADFYNAGLDLVLESLINPKVISAQVGALIRRTGIDKNRFQSQHLLLNVKTQEAFLKTIDGDLLGQCNLTPMQCHILQVFIKSPQKRIWSRDTLDDLLSLRSHFDTRAIDSSINRLRAMLRMQLENLPAGSWQIPTGYKEPFIHTKYGIGYFFADCIIFNRESSLIEYQSCSVNSKSDFDARLLESIFAEMSDVRNASGKRHQMALCLALFTLAVAAGNRGIRAVGSWLKRHQSELAELFKSPRIPSYSTIHRVLQELDEEQYTIALSRVFGVRPNQSTLDNACASHPALTLVLTFLSARDLLNTESIKPLSSLIDDLVERNICCCGRPGENATARVLTGVSF